MVPFRNPVGFDLFFTDESEFWGFSISRLDLYTNSFKKKFSDSLCDGMQSNL